MITFVSATQTNLYADMEIAVEHNGAKITVKRNEHGSNNITRLIETACMMSDNFDYFAVTDEWDADFDDDYEVPQDKLDAAFALHLSLCREVIDDELANIPLEALLDYNAHRKDEMTSHVELRNNELEYPGYVDAMVEYSKMSTADLLDGLLDLL